jgi:hypothetical protein
MMSFGNKMASAEEVRNRQPDTVAPAVLVKQPEKSRTATLGANATDKPSEQQMGLLRKLNWEGPVPETKVEASALIKRLLP